MRLRPDPTWAEYARLRRAIAGEALPLALCDLDALETNVDRLLARVRPGQALRVASKSVRCPALLEAICARGGGRISGLMCYSAREARVLADRGFSDLLVAYPSAQPADVSTLAELATRGLRVAAVIDSPAQMDPLARAACARGVSVRVVVELDVSLRLFGARLGVLRSPVRTPDEVVALARAARETRGLEFGGVMGYEAQVAGLPDRSPFSRATNPLRAALRRASVPRVAARRRAVAEALTRAGLPAPLFNGGGTGSLIETAREPWVSETTAGSGFLASHLFDYYSGLELVPAAMFALQVARTPGRGVVTCHGGGYVASGAAGADRLPRPHLPRGLELVPLEGAGEVQTPVRGAAARALRPGDPVFFRHAKAGELAEHFGEYLLVRGDQLVGRAPTYRGLGHSFA